MAWALGGFVMLSCGDAVIKTMAGQWAPTAMAATRYVFGAAGLCMLLVLREGRAGFRVPSPNLQLLRGFGVSLATVGFFAALIVMPLAEATAITFTSPMITALLSAMFMGEPARRTTWGATLFAFAGVLIVLRPNFAELGLAAGLPLLSALGMSLLMIGNRGVAGKASPLALQVFVAVPAAVMLVLVTVAGALSGMPQLAIGPADWTVIARCALVAVTASIAHWAIYKGAARAGAAAVAPMTYVQLLVATLFGVFAFKEIPDATALAGAAMIVLAGLWLLRGGRTALRR